MILLVWENLLYRDVSQTKWLCKGYLGSQRLNVYKQPIRALFFRKKIIIKRSVDFIVLNLILFWRLDPFNEIGSELNSRGFTRPWFLCLVRVKSSQTSCGNELLETDLRLRPDFLEEGLRDPLEEVLSTCKVEFATSLCFASHGRKPSWAKHKLIKPSLKHVNCR